MAGPMGPTATGGKNTYLPRYGKIDRYGSDSSSATRRCDGDDLPLVSAHSLVAALRCSSRELLRSFCVLRLPPTAHTVKECAGKRLVSERDVAIFSPLALTLLALLLLVGFFACCCCLLLLALRVHVLQSFLLHMYMYRAYRYMNVKYLDLRVHVPVT